MSKNDRVALLHALSGVAVLVLSVFTKSGFLASSSILKPIGLIIFAMGIMLFAYAALNLNKAFLGNVEPVTDRLVTSGPYMIVRHPLYLGMIISIIGLAFGMRSLWGLVGCILIFVPLCIYRAKLEEETLARKFREEWNGHKKKTYFMFPPFF